MHTQSHIRAHTQTYKCFARHVFRKFPFVFNDCHWRLHTVGFCRDVSLVPLPRSSVKVSWPSWKMSGVWVRNSPIVSWNYQWTKFPHWSWRDFKFVLSQRWRMLRNHFNLVFRLRQTVIMKKTVRAIIWASDKRPASLSNTRTASFAGMKSLGHLSSESVASTSCSRSWSGHLFVLANSWSRIKTSNLHNFSEAFSFLGSSDYANIDCIRCKSLAA